MSFYVVSDVCNRFGRITVFNINMYMLIRVYNSLYIGNKQDNIETVN